MKRKAIATVALSVLLLTGCSSVAPGQSSENAQEFDVIYPHTVNLPDGRHVLCVFEKRGYAGGTSCDWGNAK